MTFPSYKKYRMLREAAEGKSSNGPPGGNESGAIGTKVTLGDGNEFMPFEISDDPKSEHYGKNKNLSPIVRAFKQGANWGWSKDDTSGNDKPVKIGGKKLYLAGGAVRDHLKGKKARNIELATNSSPDEVYHVLKQNGFEFVSESGESKNASAKVSPNRKEGNRQFFWVKKSNKNGRPFTFGIKVNEDEFDLEVFMKTPRGNVDKELEPGTQAEDAAGRDFTINGMYILLSNDNGPNKELYDFFGGMHHLNNGRINAIGGDMSSKLKEDPSRILRYVRMLSQYGDPKKVPEEEKEAIRNSSEGLGKLDRKSMMGEFKRGMEKDDVDPREYLKLFKNFGLLDQLFPGKQVDSDLPKELSELGDKHMPLAWMLRMNDPASLEDTGMDPKDLQKIGFLIKSLGMTENIDDNSLDDLTNGYLSSGVSGRKLREWGTKLGKMNPAILDAFIGHTQDPRVKVHQTNDDGSEQIGDDFLDLVDPFTGAEDHHRIEERKKMMEWRNFQRHLMQLRS